MSPMRRILDRLLPRPLPVLPRGELPPHVRDMPINTGLLLLQMEATRMDKSPAVNNAPPVRMKEPQ